jgi:cell division septal protein FtsQ
MREGETQDERAARLKQERKDGRRDRVKLIAIWVALLVALALLVLVVIMFWPAVMRPIEFDPQKRF